MNSVTDEDVYDSRKNRTDRWSLEEPAWQEAKYIVGHVTTLGLGLEVISVPQMWGAGGWREEPVSQLYHLRY